MKEPIGAITSVQNPRHLLAKKSPRERVLSISPEVDGHAVLNHHPHAACVGTIEWTNVLEYRRSGSCHRGAFRAALGEASPSKAGRSHSVILSTIAETSRFLMMDSARRVHRSVDEC